MPDLTDPTSHTEHGSSRRTVLKGAAWAAPAIVVATTAPAFAVSPATTIVSISPANNVPFTSTPVNGNPGITLKSNVVNDAAATSPVAALTIVVTATLSNGATFVDTTMGTAPGFADATISGDATTKSFSFVALPTGLPIAPGGNLEFNPTLSSRLANGGNGTFVITPNPTPAGKVTTGSGSF